MPNLNGSDPQNPFHAIAGVTVHYRAEGAGAPVLLTHGIPGDLRTLLPVAARLADGFEAITVSLPAAPAEKRPSRPFGTEGMRDDIIDLVGALGRGPVHLVAWSFSAHAALAATIERPDLVLSLFLYEPGFPTFIENDAERDAAIADTMSAFGAVAEALARSDQESALRLAIDGAVDTNGYFSSQPPALRAVHRDNAAMIEALFTQTPPAPLGPSDLTAIRCPVTVARGAATRPCYRIVSDAAAHLIPGARHVIVPNASHLLPEQDPDTFAALTRAHVQRHCVPRNLSA